MSFSISSIRYIEPEGLRQWLKRGNSPTGNGIFSIVDVRDSDYIGGHIKNSLHYPSATITSTMDKLIRDVSSSDDIVFHCALSQQRGPSAALRFARSVRPGFLEGKTIWILQGGFTSWQELYGEDATVTEGYDSEIWKFGY